MSKLNIVERYTIAPILQVENEELRKRITELEKRIDDLDGRWRDIFIKFAEKVVSTFSLSADESSDYILSTTEEEKLRNDLKNNIDKTTLCSADQLMEDARTAYNKAWQKGRELEIEKGNIKAGDNLSEGYKRKLADKAREILKNQNNSDLELT